MNRKDRRVVTVDGPGGVGKGTLCRALADHWGWAYLDSGILYRLSALLLLERQLDAQSPQAEKYIAAMQWEQRQNKGEEEILLNSKPVALAALRSEETAALASQLAAQASIREVLLHLQRNYAADQNLIADGRDMGSVVFPQAILKIYLDASAQVRAQRRYKQLKDKGQHVNLSRLTAELAERDTRDAKRAVAPLVAAEDAIVICTDELTVEEVFARVVRLAQERRVI